MGRKTQPTNQPTLYDGFNGDNFDSYLNMDAASLAFIEKHFYN